jgi:hypothetical protein
MLNRPRHQGADHVAAVKRYSWLLFADSVDCRHGLVSWHCFSASALSNGTRGEINNATETNVMKKFLLKMARNPIVSLFAALVLCLPSLAHADEAMTTQIITYDNKNGNLDDAGCADYARRVLYKADFSGVETKQHSTFGFFGDHNSIVVRCEIDHGVVFVALSGPSLDEIRPLIAKVLEVWEGNSSNEPPPSPQRTPTPPPVYQQPPVAIQPSDGCYASSDDGYVNVRESPNGPIIGPVPAAPDFSGTPLRVLNTWYDNASNMRWSRIQTPWLERVGRTGVVATYLIRCNGE